MHPCVDCHIACSLRQFYDIVEDETQEIDDISILDELV